MIMAVPILLLVQDPLLAQVKVKVAPVVLLSNEPLRTYAGTVEPFQNVTIQSKVAGRIAGIKVEENQSVKKGEVLLSLENSRQSLSEEQKMYDRGTSTRQRLDSLKLQWSRNEINEESSRIRLLVAQKELEVRKQSYADTIVLSPLSGIVTQRFHDPGEVVGSGTALLEVIDIDQV